MRECLAWVFCAQRVSRWEKHPLLDLIKSIFLFEKEGYLENWLCILLLKIWCIIIKIVLDF